jgi:hypothetical protein
VGFYAGDRPLDINLEQACRTSTWASTNTQVMLACSALKQRRSITIAASEFQRLFVPSGTGREIDLAVDLLAIELLHGRPLGSIRLGLSLVVHGEQGYSKNWVNDRRLKQPLRPHGDPSCARGRGVLVAPTRRRGWLLYTGTTLNWARAGRLSSSS